LRGARCRASISPSRHRSRSPSSGRSGGPEIGAEVRDAHRDAVEAALDYLQRETGFTRRGADGREFVKGNGYLAAAFEHLSSRNADPQFHTHVLIANLTRGPAGRWTRLYHPAIYRHAKTTGYLYEAELGHQLTRRLGLRWRQVENGIAEIEGFSAEQLRTFSTRRREILEAPGEDAPPASSRPSRPAKSLRWRRWIQRP
jgi:conjugative relaxase-like TrwC/TraI family protein